MKLKVMKVKTVGGRFKQNSANFTLNHTQKARWFTFLFFLSRRKYEAHPNRDFIVKENLRKTKKLILFHIFSILKRFRQYFSHFYLDIFNVRLVLLIIFFKPKPISRCTLNIAKVNNFNLNS